LSAEKAAELQQHIAVCPACSKYLQDLQGDDKLLGDFTEAMQPRIARLEEKVIGALNREPSEKPISSVSIWRIIMKSRITRIAAAAAIIIAVFIIIHQFSGSIDGASVVWGQVAEKIGRIPAVVYRRTVIQPQGGLGSGIDRQVVYLSSEYGIRKDEYHGGHLSRRDEVSIDTSDHKIRVHKFDFGERPSSAARVEIKDSTQSPKQGIEIDEYFKLWLEKQSGKRGKRSEDWLQSNWYIFPAEKIWFIVRHPLSPKHRGHCFCTLLAEEMIPQWYEGTDAREWIRQALSLDYKELGRDNIDGIEVEGVEIRGRNLAIPPLPQRNDEMVVRFWVDIETDLPVRYEAVVFSERSGDWAIVADQFQWHEEVDPSIFEPNLPGDYFLASVTIPKDGQKVTIKEGAELVDGLRLFAELTDGRYPSSMPAAIVEGCKAFAKKYGGQTKKLSEKQLEIVETLASSALFHGKLVNSPKYVAGKPVGEDNDVAYYGDRVRAEDADSVLMRWKISDDQYRVIFGDLTAENVTAEKLAELERGLGK